MYPVRTPSFVRSLFPGLIWKKDGASKIVYLTFDDGPTPSVTENVLDQLEKFNAKATFFCVGKNVVKHQDILVEIRDRGHSVGNHTYSHLSGWKTQNKAYFEDVERCSDVIETSLFRPPYGRIKLSQAARLTREFDVIMWDVLSGDFDESLDADQCAVNVLNNISNGSIVVFHDSVKAWPRLRHTLPTVLKILTERGFRFEAL